MRLRGSDIEGSIPYSGPIVKPRFDNYRWSIIGTYIGSAQFCKYYKFFTENFLAVFSSGCGGSGLMNEVCSSVL